MLDLLVLRERLRAFYAKYEIIITPVVKFLITLSALILINSNAGYSEKLSTPVIYTAVAFICSVLPYGAISILLAGYILFNVYAVSMDMAIIIAVFMLCLGFLYYGFKPGDSFLLILTPLAFAFKIPYAIPLLVGLGGSIISIIPVSFGVLIYYLLMFIKANIGSLSNLNNVDILKKYTMLFNGAFADKTMFLMIVAFAICIIIVYIIRNLSITHAWGIAIISGVIAQLIIIFMGDFVYGINVPIIELLIGIAVSAVFAAVYNFFMFAVDYSHTEYAQFEDDEYYYYVKAVPKIVVAQPDTRIQKFSSGKADKKLSSEKTDKKLKVWLADKKGKKTDK